MPKKFTGMNSKVAAAMEKKAVAKAQKDAKEAEKKAKEEEDYWSQGAKGKSKAVVNKEAQKEAARQRKLERERLEQEEMAKLASKKPNPKETRTPLKSDKLTQHQIQQQKEKERLEREKQREKEEKAKSTYVADHHLLAGNKNRDTDSIEARSVEAAIDALSVAGVSGPEGSASKTAFKEYEARQFPIFKEEYPSLKLSQLKDLIYKEWKKSPENPQNQ